MRFQLHEEEEVSVEKVSDIPKPISLRLSAAGAVKIYSENPPGPPHISAHVKISLEEEGEWREGKRSKR
jgi:hypothetical protein